MCVCTTSLSLLQLFSRVLILSLEICTHIAHFSFYISFSPLPSYSHPSSISRFLSLLTQTFYTESYVGMVQNEQKSLPGEKIINELFR